MTEQQKKTLALNYMPVLYFDKKEPFPLIWIGYTVFEKSGISPSAPKEISLDKDATKCIEYAFYYDYDIQHLYDLEHVWIYLDANGKICGCESSFHGKYYNSMLPELDLLRGTDKIHLYVQPGKHAFMPAPELFFLFADFFVSCGEKAGADGILCPDIIPGMPAYTPEEDEMVETYIRKKYAFSPSMEYECRTIDTNLLLPWEEVRVKIPGRIRDELKKIKKESQFTALP